MKHLRYLIALAMVISTAAFAVELSQEVKRQLLAHPDQVCQVLEPFACMIGNLAVPIGAQHPKETIWRPMAPNDFHAVLALMQVTSVVPCNVPANQEAKLSIRVIRLIERDPKSGEEQVVSEVKGFGTSGNGQTVFDGGLFPRLPSWYAGSQSQPTNGMVTQDGGVLVIDVAQAPRFLYHGWTDPKAAAKPGMNYLVEAEVSIAGAARLQMGIDYWRETDSAYTTFDSNCQKSNNCEGYLSRWYGPTDGWQTIRVPDTLARN